MVMTMEQENMQYNIAIVSDTHGNWHKAVEELQKEMQSGVDITHLVFLGDHAEDGAEMAKVLEVPGYIVRGNCDYGAAAGQFPEEQIISIGDWRLFICHGHRYQVKQTLQNIYYRGLELGVDYVLYGHTHIAVYEPGMVTLINPGSMSEGNILMKSASWGLLTLPVEKPEEKNENFFGKYEKKTCQT